jgi:hypothetical protein
LEDTESKYSQVYRENERILLDFEENKQASYNSNNNKDAEIQRLKAEFYSLESKIKDANDRTATLDTKIVESSHK